MRGTWSVALALLLLPIAGLGCAGKQKRELRKPSVQAYDLPPLDKFKDPPTYPEDKAVLPSQRKSPPIGGPGSGPGGVGGGSPGMGGAGPGGAMSGPGGAGGAGGANGGYR